MCTIVLFVHERIIRLILNQLNTMRLAKFIRPLGMATAATLVFSGGCGVGIRIGRGRGDTLLNGVSFCMISKWNHKQVTIQSVFPLGLPIFGIVEAAIMKSDADTIGRVSNRVSEIIKYGFPGMDQILSYSDYVLSYDKRNRIPHWVLERITADSLCARSNVDRLRCNFIPDKTVHAFFRADNSDYKGSGYDRGHLAAAGNHRVDQKHLEETFYLSNIAPQVGDGFNRGSWNRLERYTRELTTKHRQVYICTGPLFLPKREEGKLYVKFEVIGHNMVSVPTHFFKVILIESYDKNLHMEAYIMPNRKIGDNVPLTTFRVPPDAIERAAGLLFFTNVQKTKLCTINGKIKNK